MTFWGKFDTVSQIDMTILDFSEAFETVPHGKLLYKMKLYGVDGNINSWLSDFLTNRKMKVVVDGEESDSVTVDSGVPQGTVLGPLLFLCHINDLPDAVKSTVRRQFADDCLLYRSIKNMDDHLAIETNLLHQGETGQDMGNALQCKEMLLNEHQPEFPQFQPTRRLHNTQAPDNPYLVSHSQKT